MLESHFFIIRVSNSGKMPYLEKVMFDYPLKNIMLR